MKDYIYNILKEVQEKTINQLNRGIALRNIDLYCRQQITNQRLPIYPHATGHGIGLEVHECPKISVISQETKKLARFLPSSLGFISQGNGE